MAFRQRKEIVVDILRRPIQSSDIVANDAIGGVTCIAVIGVGRSCVLIAVAVDAVIADAVEAQSCFRKVALVATGRSVGAHQWEAVVLVQFRNIVNQPVVGVMAASAIHSHRLLVNIGMTINALGSGI